MDAKRTGFAAGVALFALAGYVTKVISFLYRIPYQNIAGDLGLYAYQTVYPFAAIVTSLGVYALPVVIAKLGVGALDERKRLETLWASFYMLLAMSGVLTLLFWVFAPVIATALGDPSFEPVLRVIAIGYLFMPALAVLRGAFQARDDLRPSAASQIIENAIRVSFMLMVLVVGVRLGRDVYSLSAWAHAAALVGAAGALVFLLLRARGRLRFVKVRRETLVTSGRLLFTSGLAVGFASLGILWMQFLDSFTVINLLGDTIDAKTAKGVLDRGYPLLQFAVLFATALGMGNVPYLVKQVHMGHDVRIAFELRLLLRVTLVVSLAATVGLVGVMRALNVTFFGNAEGTVTLMLLASSTLFAALAIVGMTCLQALDEERRAVFGMVYGMVTKVSLSLVFIPVFGVDGAALSTALAFAVVAFYNIHQVKRVVRVRVSLWSGSWNAFVSLVPLAGFLLLINLRLCADGLTRVDACVYLVLSVIGGGVLACWMWLRMRVLSEMEWAVIPFGSRVFEFWNGRGEK